jgi:hypothetical protein
MAGETQLLYDGGRLTYTQPVVMTRGDTKQLTFAHELGYAESIAACTFTMRVPSADDTGTVVLQKTWADHPLQVDLSGLNEGTITFVNVDTAKLPVGSYQYAVEMTDVAGRIYTPVKGTFVLDWDAVHDDDTTAYPSWATLGQVRGQLEALLAVVKATLVTIAAETGDGALTVADASLFEAGDDIYVQTSGAAYEAHEVDSVDGDEIALVGTLAADVAAGNVVQKGVTA